MRNPLDLIGDADAERYDKALRIVLDDPGVDAIMTIILFQAAGIDSGVVKTIVSASDLGKKPVISDRQGGGNSL
ncbi:MAG: hypothetical protein ABIG39_02760 [Candidatus Micrarchaeota archaeon]